MKAAVFEKRTERQEDLGLSIADGRRSATGRQRSGRVMGGAASLLRGVWRDADG
jgi:hypothetical protein